MVEFNLGEHHITYEKNLVNGLWRADCSCGWAIVGRHELVLARAATHDLDTEALCDCDGCGKVGRRDDMREVVGQGDKVFCPECRELPRDREIQQAQDLLAALLGKHL